MKSCIDFPLVFHHPKLITVTFDVWGFFPWGGNVWTQTLSCNLGAWAPSVVGEASGG